MTTDLDKKRDELAVSYGSSNRHLKTSQHFADGWDAAVKELRAEIENKNFIVEMQLKILQEKKEKINEVSAEWLKLDDARNASHAQCEKLAECLDIAEAIIRQDVKLMAEHRIHAYPAVGPIQKALTDYEKFKKEME